MRRVFPYGRWTKCEQCHMVHIEQKKHKCPDGAMIKRSIEIEMEVMDEMEDFEQGLQEFWNDPKTKFNEYLVDEGKI